MDILKAHAAVQSIDADGTPHVLVEVEWSEKLRRAHRNSPTGAPATSVALVAPGTSSIRGPQPRDPATEQELRGEGARLREQAKRLRRRLFAERRRTASTRALAPAEWPAIDIVVSALGDLPPNPIVALRTDQPYPSTMIAALRAALAARFGAGTQVFMLHAGDTLEPSDEAEREAAMQQTWHARAQRLIAELMELAATSGEHRSLPDGGSERSPISRLRRRPLVHLAEDEVSFRVGWFESEALKSVAEIAEHEDAVFAGEVCDQVRDTLQALEDLGADEWSDRQYAGEGSRALGRPGGIIDLLQRLMDQLVELRANARLDACAVDRVLVEPWSQCTKCGAHLCSDGACVSAHWAKMHTDVEMPQDMFDAVTPRPGTESRRVVVPDGAPTYEVEDIFVSMKHGGNRVALVRPGELPLPFKDSLAWFEDVRNLGTTAHPKWAGKKLVRILDVQRVGGSIASVQRSENDSYGLLFDEGCFDGGLL